MPTLLTKDGKVQKVNNPIDVKAWLDAGWQPVDDKGGITQSPLDRLDDGKLLAMAQSKGLKVKQDASRDELLLALAGGKAQPGKPPKE